MSSKQSPGGSNFPYYYKGGELFGLQLGSFGSDEDRVIARMKAEEIFLIQQNRSIGIWIDLYQTKLTDRVIGELLEALNHLDNRIRKLGLVGCSHIDRWRINRRMKKARCFSTLPVKYFDDPEDAKTWLVSEPG